MTNEEVINRIYLYGKTMTQDEAMIIIEALKKQVPMKPYALHSIPGQWICSSCNEPVYYEDPTLAPNPYCPHCGQKIDWSM